MCCKLPEYRRCFFVRVAPTARRDLGDFFGLRSAVPLGCYRTDAKTQEDFNVLQAARIPKVFFCRICPNGTDQF